MNRPRRCTRRDPDTGLRCITLLCSFNPGPDCFAHSTRAQRRESTATVMRDWPTPSREAVAEHLREHGVDVLTDLAVAA